ncbi:hypothetical protein STRDD11_02583 [Streptococcus sp. DD11]|nr:hypothetical protein STRDD11_02583 [Streptococcus sp. DD11]
MFKESSDGWTSLLKKQRASKNGRQFKKRKSFYHKKQKESSCFKNFLSLDCYTYLYQMKPPNFI